MLEGTSDSFEVSTVQTPAGWTLCRVKDVARVYMGQSPESNLVHDEPIKSGIPFLQGCSEFGASNPNPSKWCVATKKMARVGATLFSVRAPVGETNLSDQKYAIGRGLCSIESVTDTNERYLFWLAGSVIRSEVNSRITGSTFEAVSVTDVRSAQIPLPPAYQQRRIADWLDFQTSRIDKRIGLLDKKRDLLGALKKSVTEESTFRGINPSAPQHESGVAWIGVAPSHWQTVRLGSLFQEAADEGREGLPMLTVSIHSGISDKELADDEMDRKVSRSEDKTVYKRVKPGDLVYNQMRAWQGAFGAAQIEGLVSPAYVVARPRRGIAPKFVEYLLRAPAAMEEIRRRSRGITDFRLRLYWDEFKNIRIALPPLDEQQAIADFLDRKLAQIDKQIALIDRLAALFKEQRKALIHEAVTGKIDLSNYEPPAQAA